MSFNLFFIHSTATARLFKMKKLCLPILTMVTWYGSLQIIKKNLWLWNWYIKTSEFIYCFLQLGYSKTEREKRMAFFLPVAWGLSWGWGLLMGACGVGAAIAAGSVLRNTNNSGFHIPRIHRNQPTLPPLTHQPTTPPVTHQPTAPQVTVQHTTPPPVTVLQPTTQPVHVQHKMVFFAF